MKGHASVLTPADLLLREQFESKSLENAAFRHREHVRLTWVYLTLEPPEAVETRLCASLLDLASSHGAATRFHLTLTKAWVRIVESARRAHPDAAFGDLVTACPWLLDKDTPLTYYSRDVLYSDEARTRWIEPNLRALLNV